MKVSPAVEQALQTALKARSHSHSPYSGFAVGAALKLMNKAQAIGGCNVENASYGGTICAERVAVNAAVAQQGKIEPEFLVVVTAATVPTVPCALCLQTLAEFCPDDFTIYLANLQQVVAAHKLKEFLPFPFRAFKADQK